MMLFNIPLRDLVSYAGIIIGVEWAALQVYDNHKDSHGYIRVLDVDKENLVEIARIMPGGEVKLYDIKPAAAASKFWRIMMEQKLKYKCEKIKK